MDAIREDLRAGKFDGPCLEPMRALFQEVDRLQKKVTWWTKVGSKRRPPWSAHEISFDIAEKARDIRTLNLVNTRLWKEKAELEVENQSLRDQLRSIGEKRA